MQRRKRIPGLARFYWMLIVLSALICLADRTPRPDVTEYAKKAETPRGVLGPSYSSGV